MTISVVIPVFNEAADIADCLESLQRQRRPADEIIIVDNNSTDDSIAIASCFNVVVVSETLQGIAAASRTGMNAATGDIIARCDADSRLPDDWLQQIETLFSEHHDAVAVTGPGYFYDTNALNAFAANIWYMYAYFLLVGSAIANWPLFGSNYAIRRRDWLTIRNDVHYKHDDIHDDIDVTMHLPATAKILLSRKLTVGISARALQRGKLPLRYRRGMRSLTMHWPERSPMRRWMERLKR